MNQILLLDRMLRDAAAKSAKLAEARANLPPGSSRARVTTANAKWARAAEAREGLARRLAEAVEALHDPAEIADVLAGALRGRGVEGVEVLAGDDGLFGSYHADGLAMVWDAVSLRWRLTKLLSAGLCSADEALRLLEGT